MQRLFLGKNKIMNKTAIFTSCAANYIPKARVLASTVKNFHSNIDIFLLIVDDIPTQFNVEEEDFDFVVTAEDLAIDNFNSWIFKHNIVEACTAVKPFMLRYLLAKGYEQICYFDPDIAIFSPLDDLLAEFSDNSILLTPHICEPETSEEAVADNEICALAHGVFNFGYVGVKNDEIGNNYAQWWQKRCYQACFDDIANGIFTDQKWNDLTPIFFDKVKILKNPEYNVATWNYAQRKISGSVDEGFTVNGKNLVFHHFTGYDSGAHHKMLDKYGKNMPATIELSRWYEAECKSFKQQDLEIIKWKYGYYDNGEAIQNIHRLIYRQRVDLQLSFPNPAATSLQNGNNICFYKWLENEGLINENSIIADNKNNMSFLEFIQKTQIEICQYINRTNRLYNWQKKLATQLCNLLFFIIKAPIKN